MIVTYGVGAACAAPTRCETTWPDLVSWLRAIEPHTGPKDGDWLCFADFGSDTDHPHGRQRAYTNLIGSYAVPLDLDLGQYAWTAADIAARLTGYQFVAWTSYSHAPEAPRWRIVVPVERSMSRAEHYATWETLCALFARDAGESSKDATRLNYLPGACLHPEHAQFITGEGASFPVSAAAAPVPTGTADSASVTDLTDAPIAGYSGPEDDDQLIAYMRANRRSAEDAFTQGPTRFEALWTADAAALAVRWPPIEHDQQFEHTRADAALANELAFYTGSHGTRMLDLFLRSALAQRDRFREDKARRACVLACQRDAKQHAFISPRVVANPSVTISIDGSISGPLPPDAPAGTVSMTDPPGESGDTSYPPQPDGTGGSVSQAGDFFAYLPQHDYIHRPTGMHWPAASLDGTVGKDSRMMLDLTHPVHLLSWAPGLPERFQWGELDTTDHLQATAWTYNRYRAPRRPRAGDPSQWLALLNALYPNDADHILKYLADAVQNPGRKCNHALVLGSDVHGIGKDTLLSALKWGVGEKNYATISPHEIFKDNNGWVASVVVQVSESRNVGESDGQRISKYDMYERTKDLCAAPPNTLSCVDKWVARHQVRNVLRLILTTNHGIDGVYMPPQDRRHYCAWSDAPAMSEIDATAFYKWLAGGGGEAVAAFLQSYPLNDWNPGARPPRTAWWHRLVQEAEGDENPLAEAIERIGAPEWLTAEQLSKEGGPAVASWFADSRNRRHVARHLAPLGYRRIPNPNEKRGRFMFNREARVVYGKPTINPATFNPAGR